jgi:hypothetical protein
MDLIGATARLPKGFLVTLSHIDPQLDSTRQIFLSEIRLVFGAQSSTKRQGLMRVPRKGEQADHHTLIRFGRMARQGEHMVSVVVPIYVGNVQSRFENGGVRSHEVVVSSFQESGGLSHCGRTERESTSGNILKTSPW